MKKIFTFFLIAILLLSAIPALADNVRQSGPYTYEIKGNGTVVITDYAWADVEFTYEELHGDGYNIFIPNMLDGYTISGIGDRAFAQELTDKNVILGDAWYMWPSVNVTLSENIKSIGSEAFDNLTVKSINIPDSVQHIGYYALASGDTQIKMSSSHPYYALIDGCLYNKGKKELIRGRNIKGESLTIPEGIVSIGEYAFTGCWIQNDINFPSTLKSLENHAFESVYINRGCLNFNRELEKIGDYAFYEATFNSVSNETLPLTHTSVSYIGDYAFADSTYKHCNDKRYHDDPNFYLPSSLEHLGKHAFENIHFEKTSIDTQKLIIVIPADCQLKALSDYAFNDFDGIVVLDTPEIIEQIGVYVGCGNIFNEPNDFSPKITHISSGLNPAVNELPVGINSIASNAFNETVVDFKLPSSVNEIALDAFPKYSTFIVEAGSYSELWCSENGFSYSVEGEEMDLSWLNN